VSLWQRFRCWIGSHSRFDVDITPLDGDSRLGVTIIVSCPHCGELAAHIDLSRHPRPGSGIFLGEFPPTFH
jgi:hypothetical protein